MTVQTEATLKGYFDTGDSITEANMDAFVESATRTRVRVATATPVTIVDDEDRVVIIDTTTIAAAVTVNLPAGSNGKIITIIDRALAGTYNITIDGNLAETINGAATYTISTNRGKVTLVWDGTGWLVAAD